MLFECKDVSKTIGRERILDHVTFSVDAGEIALVTGPEASGKTLLLSMIAGIVPCNNGTITLEEGKSMGHLFDLLQVSYGNSVYSELHSAMSQINEREIRLYAMEIGLMYMKGETYRSYQKEYEKEAKAMEADGTYDYQKAIPPILEGLGFSEDQNTVMIGSLKEAEQRRVLLARHLFMKKDLLVMDSPEEYLTPESIGWLTGFTKEHGIAIIAASRKADVFGDADVKIIEL